MFLKRRTLARSRGARDKLIIGGLVILSLFLLRSLYYAYEERSFAKKQYHEIQASLIELEERKKALSKEIDTLKTSRGIEEELRTRFNVAKPGEETVVIVEPVSKDAEKEDGGFWKKVRGWFQRD